MAYNPNIHHRRSIRLKGYDYSQEGLYFITICCQNRDQLFGHIENGEMILNDFGKIAQEEWANSGIIRDNILIHEYIIMPNHIHGIIEILFKKGESKDSKNFGELGIALKSPSQTIGSIIRGYKIATIKKIKDYILSEEKNKEREEREEREESTGELQFAPTAPTPTEKIKSLNFKIWQRNYYENIIRDDRAYHNISNYIINNPQKWGKDKFYRK